MTPNEKRRGEAAQIEISPRTSLHTNPRGIVARNFRAQLDTDGRHATDPSGKKLYCAVCEIKNRDRRDAFNNAIDKLLAGTQSSNGAAKFDPIIGEIVP